MAKKGTRKQQSKAQIHQELDEYEKSLRETYRRSDDQALIQRKLTQFERILLQREIDEDSRSEDSIRDEEHKLIDTTMVISLIAIGIFLVLAIAYQDQMDGIATAVREFITTYMSWFYLGLTSVFIVFLFYLAFSRYGNVILGDPAKQPEFSRQSWYAMMFSAGIGVGLMFYGGSEPLIHYLEPPIGQPETREAAEMAFALSAFIWGFHTWAIFSLCALGVAFFGFRRRKKYLMSSSTVELLGSEKGRYYWKLGTDTISTLAIIFGIATSLGMGVLQLATGLEYAFEIPAKGSLGYAGILLAMTACFLLSATTGLEKGIKYLSNFNMVLAILLLIFVFGAGPSLKILDTFVETIGLYLQNILRFSLSTGANAPAYKDWVGEWPVTTFAWVIAWAPFVGVFIARISRGRSIREVILGSLILPSLFSIFWFATFGGSVLDLVVQNPESSLKALVLEDKTIALFALLQQLPLAGVTQFLSIILLFVFLVTSADSATFVVAMMTTEGDLDPSMKIKVIWGGIIAMITLILLTGGGLGALRAASLCFALPFSFVLIGVLISLYIRLSHTFGAPRV